MPRSLRRPDRDDLERELLRKSVGALTAGRHECADCGRTPLVGEHVHRYGARRRGLRAVPPGAPRRRPSSRHRARHRRSARLALRAVAGRHRAARRLSAAPRSRLRAGPWIPVQRVETSIIAAPARGGLRVPRRHREPRGVHRPLPGRLAPDARGHLRHRRRRALPGRARRFNRFPLGRPDARRGRAPAAASSSAGAPASSTASGRVAHLRARRAAGGRHARDVTLETEPKYPSDRLIESLGGRAGSSAGRRRGAAPPALDPRGGPRPRARAPRSPAGRASRLPVTPMPTE